MTTSVPTGYTTVTPWLITRDTAGLLEFLRAAFGAQELARVANADGSISHAEARIGDAIVLLFDAEPDWPPTPAFLRIYVDDTDSAFERAIAAGAEPVTPPSEAFGERSARVRDRFGNLWWLQSHVRDVTPAEIERDVAEWTARSVDPGRHSDRTLDRAMRGSRRAQDGGATMRLEMVPVPVTDVDRAKAFYVDRIGFHADFDVRVNEQLRFVQLTPPGSDCSVVLGEGVVKMEPGTQKGPMMVVSDVAAVRQRLLDRGVAVSEIDVQPWGRFVYFSDPDGNEWTFQELPKPAAA